MDFHQYHIHNNPLNFSTPLKISFLVECLKYIDQTHFALCLQKWTVLFKTAPTSCLPLNYGPKLDRSFFINFDLFPFWSLVHFYKWECPCCFLIFSFFILTVIKMPPFHYRASHFVCEGQKLLIFLSYLLYLRSRFFKSSSVGRFWTNSF